MHKAKVCGLDVKLHNHLACYDGQTSISNQEINTIFVQLLQTRQKCVFLFAHYPSKNTIVFSLLIKSSANRTKSCIATTKMS